MIKLCGSPRQFQMTGDVELFSQFGKEKVMSLCAASITASLLSLLGQPFVQVLLAWLRPAVLWGKHCPEQAGVSRGRSTTEQIFAIRQLIEQSKEFNRCADITFVDFKVEFDSVCHESLWKVFSICGIPPALLEFTDLFTLILVGLLRLDINSEEFQIQSVVQKGCMLAPRGVQHRYRPSPSQRLCNNPWAISAYGFRLCWHCSYLHRQWNCPQKLAAGTARSQMCGNVYQLAQYQSYGCRNQ